LSVGVTIVKTDRVCNLESQGSVCRVSVDVSVSLQETSGREVAVESLAGMLYDTRAMQDLRASPASMSSADIRAAAGASTMAAGGTLKVPYTLSWEYLEPAIVGPTKAIVRVRGMDSSGNVVEATGEGF
jgi:hypothetical protein